MKQSALNPSRTPSPGGMIVREKEPVNLEMPFGSLDSFLTPVARFYVRCHHPIPKIDLGTWRLKIEGDVEEPFDLTLEELRAMEKRTITTTMECAGNGRSFLTPQRDGAQWEGGAVGTAEWTGVPLSALLQRAGVRNSVREVILEGADEGEIKEPPRPAGKIHYSRSLPLSKAKSDVLLAFQMNGEDLTAEHGFPLRAVVPGWYGMAAVKWLTRIVARTEPYHGYYQTIDYAYWERGSSAPTLLPITEMRVKAQIARPEFAEAVRASQPYRVHGAAWTTGAEITRVEISTDGGTVWNEARLLGDSLRNADNADHKLPALTIGATSEPLAGSDTAFRGEVGIIVESEAHDTTAAAHGERVEAVRVALANRAQVIAAINATARLHIYGYAPLGTEPTAGDARFATKLRYRFGFGPV